VRTLETGFASSFSCDFRFPKNRRKGHLDLPALMILVVAGWVCMGKYYAIGHKEGISMSGIARKARHLLNQDW
jgi:hypothetical protein